MDALYLMKSERKSTRCWKMKQPPQKDTLPECMPRPQLLSQQALEIKGVELLLAPILQQRKTHAEPRCWCGPRRKASAEEHSIETLLCLLAAPMWPALWTAMKVTGLCHQRNFSLLSAQIIYSLGSPLGPTSIRQAVCFWVPEVHLVDSAVY